MLLDKVMLIGALKNDLSIFQNRINEITEIGKLMGKHELTSQFISSLEEGRFDFVSKEDGQKVAEKQMDKMCKDIENETNKLKEGNLEMLATLEELKKL